MITCFDISERECKIVSLSESKNGLYIHNALTVEFPQTDSQDPKRFKIKGELIKEALKQNRLKISSCILLIPKQSVTVRLVSLPSSNDAEITQMARFEAERHIPFNVERHIISHHVMRKEGVSGSKVLISAVDSPIVDDCIEILNVAGIEIEAADISSLSLFNWFLSSKPNFKDDITTALIHIGNSTTDITLIRKDLVIYTRSTLHGMWRFVKDLEDTLKPTKPLGKNFFDEFDMFFPERAFKSGASPESFDNKDSSVPPTPSQEQQEQSQNVNPDSYQIKNDKPFMENQSQTDMSTESFNDYNNKDISHPARKVLQEWINKLFQEIRRTYEFARREFECPPIQKIYLSGDIARCNNVIEFFSKNLGVEICFNPGFDMIKPHPKAKPTMIPENLQPYAEALGGACREILPNTLKINLLSPSYINKKLFKSKKRNFMWVGMFVFLALVLAFIYLKERMDYKENLLKWYRTHNEKNATEVEKLEDMDKKLKIIIREVDNERSALAILDKISSFPYIPSRLTITDFMYIGGDSVNISGHSLEIEDLNKFLSDLEASGFFSIVRLKQRAPYELPYRPRKVQSFEINCFFEKKNISGGKK